MFLNIVRDEALLYSVTCPIMEKEQVVLNKCF